MAQGAYILGCAGTTLGSDEAAFLREADPWGMILFARNVEAPDQVRRITSELRALLGRHVPVLVDQEGGRVQRLGKPHWRAWPDARETVRRAGDAAARAMYLRARLIAAELADVGIDVNCAPVADIATDVTHLFLADRCYGNDLGAVTANAAAMAEGLMDGGVLPVVKHMPGHGRATQDSHLDLPRVTARMDALQARDFAAFKALAHLPIGMTAHIVFDAIDAERPATLSADAIAAIRGPIGFDGLLMTDDIGMGALVGSMAERTAASLAAGCDVVLHCSGDLAEMQAVAEAAGTLRKAAQARADRALAAKRAPDAADQAAMAEELAALTGGAHG